MCTPTWLVGRGDDALYVRAYSGRASHWYQAASKQKAGRISVAGMTKDVAFAPVDRSLINRIYEAYRLKHRDSRYIESKISTWARAATMEIKLRGVEDARSRAKGRLRSPKSVLTLFARSEAHSRRRALLSTA